MKKIKIIPTLLISTFFVFLACSESNSFEPITNDSNILSKENILNIISEDISPSENNSLQFMREEEKLARDVYILLYNKYGLKVFNNISSSEQTHTNAIKYLIEKYSLNDPVQIDVQGVYQNTKLQELYNKLIAQGSQSNIEALKVGALIEEVDIADLVKAMNEEVDNQDIKMVYNNLKLGSENHLRAFVKNLAANGINYVPQVLDIDTYNSIIK